MPCPQVSWATLDTALDRLLPFTCSGQGRSWCQSATCWRSKQAPGPGTFLEAGAQEQ